MRSIATLEFFGATTFRLRTNELTILHDSWLDKPVGMKRYIELEDVVDLDYIVISHAHFDHLPGADRIALRTGAVVIANCEAINTLRKAGVPENQLLPVAGGERVPLFTRDVLRKASIGEIDLADGPPLAPRRPHSKHASAAVHVWPSLHCLMPGTSVADVPDIFDTGKVYTGAATEFDSTLDITRLMQHGMFRLNEFVPKDHMDEGMRSFAAFVEDRDRNIMSHCDGGQLMYNFVLGGKAVLFNTNLGAYEGIMRSLTPKPDFAILAVGGRANLNGRPFEGSAAQFLTNEAKWLDEPGKIMFCLHDESLVKPYRCNMKAAEDALSQMTTCQVIVPEPGNLYTLFE